MADAGRPWATLTRLSAVALSLALGGCACPALDRALLADRTPAGHGGDLSVLYSVHCPDVLDIRIGGPYPWQGRRAVGADGRVRLDHDALSPRLEGLTAADAAKALAAGLHLRPEEVQVRVAAYESQQLFLHGEVNGLQRAVPYVGPETVLELLQRVGGLTGGAAPADVQVVRPHVADGSTPEVFTIDLAAIVLRKDQQTNIRLEPFDQVYIGQSDRARLGRCLPPWLRHFLGHLLGLPGADEPASGGPSSGGAGASDDRDGRAADASGS